MDNHIIKSFQYSNEFNIFKFIGDISDINEIRKVIDKCIPGEIKRIINNQFELEIIIDYSYYIDNGFPNDIFINDNGYIHQGIFIEKYITEFDGLTVPDIQRHNFDKFTQERFSESITKRIMKFLISIGLNVINTRCGKYSIKITFEFKEKTIEEFKIMIIGLLKDKIKSKGLSYEIDGILNKLCKQLHDDLIGFNTNKIQIDEKLFGPSIIPTSFGNHTIEFSKQKDQIEIIKITQNESILFLSLMILKLESKIESFYRLGNMLIAELSTKLVPWAERKGTIYLDKNNGEVYINRKHVKSLKGKSLRFFEILYDKIDTKVNVRYIGNVLDKREFKEEQVNQNIEYKATLLKMKNRFGDDIRSRIDSDEDWFILHDR